MQRKTQPGAMEILSRYRSAVMGIAALWVLILHCWMLVVPNRPILGRIEALVKWNGTMGVEIFLFYSGLGLTYSIRKGGLKQYYASRLRRIVFPYWAMAVLCAVTWGWSISKLLKVASGAAFVTESIFALLWFVPALFVLYLLFPAYHRLMMRSGDKTAFTLCALMIWLGASMLLREKAREDVWTMTNRIPCFLIGVWMGEICRERDVRLTGTHWALCVLSLAMGWMLRDYGNEGYITLFPQFYFVPSALIGVSLCFLFSGLFAGLEACGGPVKRCAGLLVRFLSFVGMFSLELYCVQEWLYGYIYVALDGHIGSLEINFISMALLLLAGWTLHMLHRLFWRAVDSARRTAR